MYIRIATVKFPSDDKADAFIAMMKTVNCRLNCGLKNYNTILFIEIRGL